MRRGALAIALLFWACSCLAQAPKAYDSRAFNQAVGKVGSALFEGDFERLETMHQDFQEPHARADDGRWMMGALELGISRDASDLAPARLRKTFADWKARRPDSTARPIVEALTWLARAWRAKGGGCYARAASESRSAFDRLVGQAADALRDAETRGGQQSPAWHSAALLVAGAQGRPAADLDAIFQSAAERFPTYEPIYRARLEFLLPDWGGDFARMDAFARDAARRTHAEEGGAFYTRLYVDLVSEHPCGHLFEDSMADWPEMKRGFDDLLAHHPATWNTNIYATFACRMRDVDTTRRLLGELGSHASLGLASLGVSNDSCYAMIKPKPEPIRQG